MPLEDLVGPDKFIDDFNKEWPDGDEDYPNISDDNLRGIKNVLQNTFPNVDGPVTLTQDQLNTGAIPAGESILFYRAGTDAPTGYTRVALTDDYLIRVVAETEGGGVVGGTSNPILNNTVALHTHGVNGNVNNSNPSHSHGAYAVSAPNHTHQAGEGTASGIEGSGSISGGGSYGTFVKRSTAAAGAHSHQVDISTVGINHNHAINVTTGNPTNSGNWTPRYADFVLCQKS